MTRSHSLKSRLKNRCYSKVRVGGAEYGGVVWSWTCLELAQSTLLDRLFEVLRDIYARENLRRYAHGEEGLIKQFRNGGISSWLPSAEYGQWSVAGLCHYAKTILSCSSRRSAKPMASLLHPLVHTIIRGC